MFRRLTVFCASLVVIGGVAGATWWRSAPPPSREDVTSDLPVPPFPPRIAQGSAYETCLDTLTSDPTGAVALAET